MSAVVAELTTRGLATLGQPLQVTTDAVSGFPVLSLGDQTITADDVATALDDE